MATKKNGNGNGNGNGDHGDEPVRPRRITAGDLTRAAEAAQAAATAASNAAEAVVVALESGGVDQQISGLEEGQLSADDDGIVPSEGRVAFEEFMAQLQGQLKRAGASVDVTENARWVKIESRKNGHKIYVAKGKTQVNRIESTIPPDLIAGAEEPDRKNGRIASYLPADPKSVGEAIRYLAQGEEHLRPPQRGGAVAPKGQGGGGGGRRPQAKFN